MTALARVQDAPGIAEYDARALNAAQLRDHYARQGVVIVRGAIDTRLTDQMAARWRSFFGEIIARERGERFDTYDLDLLHAQAAACVGEARAKHFLTMGRDFPAFNALVGAPGVQTIMRTLFETDDLQTIADSNTFRIDLPGPNITNLEWHQDYPYNMLAMCAATAWMPILPVTGDMGRLQVRLGVGPVQPIAYDDVAKAQFHNSRYMRIRDLDTLTEQWEGPSIAVPDLYPGDVLILHALALHRSGVNHSTRARWVATARYGPFMDEALYQRSWFTMRAKYPDLFRSIHPDLFSKAT